MTSSTLPLPGGPTRPRRALPTGSAQCAALLCVLFINALVADNFFAIHIQDGRLFGSLIDILNRCAPVALLSLGMTLVIAT
ncbi:ABC transporter permease, partial [Aeromonas rivipollensis]